MVRLASRLQGLVVTLELRTHKRLPNMLTLIHIELMVLLSIPLIIAIAYLCNAFREA